MGDDIGNRIRNGDFGWTTGTHADGPEQEWRPPTNPRLISVTDLPGRDVLRPTPQIVAEQRGRKGGRRGRSSVVVPEPRDRRRVPSLDPVGKTVEIAHYVEPVEAHWASVARQRLFVWARFADDPTGTIAGARFLHPDGVADLQNPDVWFADNVQTKPGVRGHGIASALYAHLQLHGYAVTRSETLMGGESENARGNGVRLWQERLHPDYDEDLAAKRLRTCTGTFTLAKLNELVTRFAADPQGQWFDLLGQLDEFKWGFRSWPMVDNNE